MPRTLSRMIWPVAKASPGFRIFRIADFPAIDAHFFREQIHDAFHRELSLIAAKAAHGAAGRIVGEYGLGVHVHVGHAIDAAGMARRAQQTFAARARVASRIADDANAHGEQMAFRVRADFVFQRHGMALARGAASIACA